MIPETVLVVREAQNKLSRHRWVFDVRRSEIILTRYMYETKAGKDASFKVRKVYERDRDGDYGDWEWVPCSDVPWDEDLELEALAGIVQSFKVVKDANVP